MNARGASWLAWSLAGISLALFVAGTALYALARSAHVSSRDIGGVGEMLVIVPFLAFLLVGALLASRRPRNPIGWILLADGFLWMLIVLIDYYGDYGLASPGSLPFPVAVAALSQWFWVPTVGLLGIYLLLLFPDGRLPSRRWRPLAWLSGVMIVLLSTAEGLYPGPLPERGGVRNPFGLEEHPWIADAEIVLLPLLPLCILASAVSLVLRFRRSGGEVREQIKWIAFAAAFMGLLYLVSMGVGMVKVLISAPETPSTGGELPSWFDILWNVAVLSFAGVPVAVGFAVLRYRLYDIEVIINRALVYGALTASLALAYLGSVVFLQYILRALTGEGSQLAVVASTLTIAALFSPLRQRIQGFIDRRFYRKKYDAQKTLAAFSSRLRDETDLEALSDDLVAVARGTVQPAHASLWLREPMSYERRAPNV